VKRPAVAGSRTKDTSGLSCQCRTTTNPHNPLCVLWYTSCKCDLLCRSS